MENTKTQNKKFNNNSSLTLMLMLIAGFLVFWLLAAGSLTENRFGTHILFNGDMNSSPVWYILTISYISILFMIGAMVLLSLELRGKFKLNVPQEKVIRIISFLIIGISGFMIGISAISFATFQTAFFKSQLFHPHMFGSLAVADQGLAIGSISLILIIGAMAVMTFFMFAKIEFNDKLYFVLRNVSIAAVAAGWFIFNMNVNAFGAMGGDLNVLVKGITDGKVDLTKIDGENLIQLGNMDAEVFYDDFVKPLDDWFPNWWIADKFFTPLWEGGTIPKIPFITKNPINVPGQGLHYLLLSIGTISRNLHLSLFDKSGSIFGTNNSIAADLLFTTTMASIVALPIYGTYTYYKVEDNSKSFVYDASIFIIIGVTALYGFLAWITPYIPVGSNEYIPSMKDALLNGKYNLIAPGLVAAPGMHGGLASAAVYYFPLYKGTITWWITFSIMFIIPVISIALSIFTNEPKATEKLIKKPERKKEAKEEKE